MNRRPTPYPPVVRAAAWAAAAAALAGCSPVVQDQSFVDPVGEVARAVDVHGRTMLWVGGAVFVIVMALVLVAVLRRGHNEGRAADVRDGPASTGDSRRWTLFVAVGGG